MRTIKLNNLNINGENRRTILIVLALFYSTIFYYIEYILSKNYVLSLLIPVLIGLVIVFCAVYCLNSGYLRLFRLGDATFLFVVFLAILLSILLNIQNIDIISERYLKVFFVESIPYFLLGFIFVSGDKHKKTLKYFTIFSIFLGVVYVFYMKSFGNAAALSEDNMGLSYNYLPIVMMSFVFLLTSYKKTLSLLSFFVGLILLVSLGTRGPIVILLTFCIVCLIHFLIKTKIRGKVIWVGLIILIAFLIFFGFQGIISTLSGFMSRIGMSTRVLDKISQSSVFIDSDRSYITKNVLDLIKDRPITGYGVGGEWEYLNWNAHNMYLSILQNFGIIVGSIIIVSILLLSLRAFFVESDVFLKYIILTWICIVFVQGFFGGEYLSKDVFFLIGISVSTIRLHKNHSIIFGGVKNELLYSVR